MNRIQIIRNRLIPSIFQTNQASHPWDGSRSTNANGNPMEEEPLSEPGDSNQDVSQVPEKDPKKSMDKVTQKNEKAMQKNVVLPWLELTSDQVDSQSTPLKTEKKSSSTVYQKFRKSMRLWWKPKPVPKITAIPEVLPTFPPLRDIKRIIVIGVHGWFPNRIFNRVIGEPVGNCSTYFTCC